MEAVEKQGCLPGTGGQPFVQVPVEAAERKALAQIEAAGRDIVRLGLETQARKAHVLRPADGVPHQPLRRARAAPLRIDGKILDDGEIVPAGGKRDIADRRFVSDDDEERLVRQLDADLEVGGIETVALGIGLDGAGKGQPVAVEGRGGLAGDEKGKIAGRESAKVLRRAGADPHTPSGRSFGSNWMMVIQSAVSAGLRSFSTSTVAS